MRIISAIWSSWLHSQLWEPLWQGLFSSVRYYGHSGSQEIGHLKLVVFAGEWLFEEFLRANGAYRGFFLKKPFTINTVGFTTVCSSKSHMPPLQWIFPLCAPHLTFFPCVPPSEFFTVLMVYGFLRSPQRKNPLYARLLAKTPQKATLPQKPPIWGALIPPGLNAKAKKTWAPDTWLRTFSQALNLLTHPNFDTLKQHNWKGPAALMLAHLFEQSTYAEDRTE